jgi:hypothetical protein
MKTGLRQTKMLNFRVTTNMVNRLKRASEFQGVSQTAIIIRALERELMRWEKEYAEKMRIEREFDKTE